MNTIEAYQNLVTKHIVPALGHPDLDAPTRKFVEVLWREAGVRTCPTTLQVHQAILSAALKAALRQGVVTGNVATLTDGRPRARRDGEQAGHPLSEHAMAAAMDRIIRMAGLRRITLHELRHTSSSESPACPNA